MAGSQHEDASEHPPRGCGLATPISSDSIPAESHKTPDIVHDVSTTFTFLAGQFQPLSPLRGRYSEQALLADLPVRSASVPSQAPASKKSAPSLLTQSFHDLGQVSPARSNTQENRTGSRALEDHTISKDSEIFSPTGPLRRPSWRSSPGVTGQSRVDEVLRGSRTTPVPTEKDTEVFPVTPGSPRTPTSLAGSSTSSPAEVIRPSARLSHPRRFSLSGVRESTESQDFLPHTPPDLPATELERMPSKGKDRLPAFLGRHHTSSRESGSSGPSQKISYGSLQELQSSAYTVLLNRASALGSRPILPARSSSLGNCHGLQSPRTPIFPRSASAEPKLVVRDPIYIDIDKRQNVDVIFPDTSTQRSISEQGSRTSGKARSYDPLRRVESAGRSGSPSTPLIYRPPSQASVSGEQRKQPLFVPAYIILPRDKMSRSSRSRHVYTALSEGRDGTGQIEDGEQESALATERTQARHAVMAEAGLSSTEEQPRSQGSFDSDVAEASSSVGARRGWTSQSIDGEAADALAVAGPTAENPLGMRGVVMRVKEGVVRGAATMGIHFGQPVRVGGLVYGPATIDTRTQTERELQQMAEQHEEWDQQQQSELELRRKREELRRQELEREREHGAQGLAEGEEAPQGFIGPITERLILAETAAYRPPPDERRVSFALDNNDAAVARRLLAASPTSPIRRRGRRDVVKRLRAWIRRRFGRQPRV